MNPNPSCADKCLFKQEGPAFTTIAHFVPVYDKDGNNVNVDGNSSFYDVRCLTCGKLWSAVTQYSSTTFKEKK